MRKVTKGFENSPEKRECKKCKGKHGIGYVTKTNGQVDMLMWCDVKKETSGAPFEPGLDIPSVLSMPARKHNRRIAEMKQSSIFKYLVGRNKRSIENMPAKIVPY